MRSHFWFPQLWCSLSLPTIKQVLLLLLCSILTLFPSVLGLPFPLHCLISASSHIVSIPADPPISQALSHPTHHAHSSRITHVKYALVSSLSKSTMLCVPFTVRTKSSYPRWLAGFPLSGFMVPQPVVYPIAAPWTLLLATQRVLWALHSQLLLTQQLPRPVKKLKREEDRIWGEFSLQTPRS